MTEEEKILGAAIAAQSAGRAIVVLSAGNDEKKADLILLAWTADIIREPKTALIWSMPRVTAELLVLDLNSALNSEFLSVEDAVRNAALKGPQA